jgi:hypothetical protein
MIAALLYKEYREHRVVWLALAVVAAGGMLGVPQLIEPENIQRQDYRELLGGVAALLAWASGVVCGALLLASETEGGTQTFLDTLPAGRLPLWVGKCMVGLLFVSFQVVLLGVLAGAQGFYPGHHRVAGAILLVGAGLVGYAWGLFFSALAGTVLNAIGLAILFQFVFFQFVGYTAFLLSGLLGLHSHLPLIAGILLLVVILAVVVAPLPLSALVYSRMDRGRLARKPPSRRHLPAWLMGWRETVWLTWQQMRGGILGLALFSLIAGLLLIGKGLFVWPLLSLAIGAFCGVFVFLDEQTGPYRFLGEQRLPLGLFWFIKVAMRFGLVLFSLLLMLVPATIALVLSDAPEHGQNWPLLARLLDSPLIGLTIPGGLFLFLWPVYGFTVGPLCGVLFPKPLVALVVAFGVAAALAGLWAPSLVTGDLHLWQVAGIPLVLLVCSRLLMRPWVSDRLLSLTVGCRLTASVGLCAGLMVLGLWYRVAEVPSVAEPEDFAAFVASLPAAEENEAGQLIQRACSRLEDANKQWKAPPLEEIIIQGWPDQTPEVAGFLDRAFASDWWKDLRKASRKPVGVVEDPRRMTILATENTLVPARLASQLLAARGLQMQKKGDPALFVAHFAIALNLAQNLQNRSRRTSAWTGRTIEAMQLRALERWLEQLGGRPDLLRRAAEVLRRYQDGIPPNSHGQHLAEYLIALNSLKQPDEWLTASLVRLARSDRPQEPAVLAAMWMVPWEQARQRRRLLALHWAPGFAPGLSSRPESSLAVPIVASELTHGEAGRGRRMVHLGAAELMLALRRFQADNGKPAESLEVLVPKYLSRLPNDPFARQPIRYRLSKGEEIVWREGVSDARDPGPFPDWLDHAVQPTRRIPAGQGILWSVGEDGRDDDAKRQGRSFCPTRKGFDLIYLVPLPVTERR